MTFEELCERQGWNCYWCGAPMRPHRHPSTYHATKEHLYPQSLGGRRRISSGNVAAAHWVCNNARGTMRPDDFRDLIAKKPTWPPPEEPMSTMRRPAPIITDAENEGPLYDPADYCPCCKQPFSRSNAKTKRGICMKCSASGAIQKHA